MIQDDLVWDNKPHSVSEEELNVLQDVQDQWQLKTRENSEDLEEPKSGEIVKDLFKSTNDNTKSSISVYIGDINGYTEMKLKTLIDEYKPFVESFTSVKDLMSAYRKSKQPIMASKRLLILEVESEYNFYLNLINTLANIGNRSADIILKLKPKKKFTSYEVTLPDNVENNIVLKIINTKATYKSDFKEYLRTVLSSLNDGSTKELLSRIGYSYKLLNQYLPELLEVSKDNQKPLERSDIKKIIGIKHLPPLESVLEKLVQGDKTGYKQTLEYMDRYSEPWVLKYYEDAIAYVIELKIKYKKGEIKNINLNSERNLKYRGLVLNTRFIDIINFKNILKTNKYPLEYYMFYRKLNTTKTIVKTI